MLARLSLVALRDAGRPMRPREISDQIRSEVDVTDQESELIGAKNPQP